MQCLEQWGLWRESGTAETFAFVADLETNVKQIPASISIVSYIYLFVGFFYLVDYLIVYLYVLAMGHTLSFSPHGIVLVVLHSN